ncbi:response regulator [Bradyrhizobium sp. LHD-71]|uniref:response regulator transcription factor n=1 Tax=Bradyrhizobium sp. LHD-71 TaxID=3072141 RepID=UPI00280FD5AB|nr:response regulator [Bradyrhizobium sp. LHD-71]MDQ8728539.1 response regulator [Bradyrhizobium sp. LHD-71]
MTTARIAIVDDDDSLRTAVAGLLRSHGYSVCGHESAESFLASSDIGQVDCIVSDIHMPGMSGIELKKRLDTINDDTPVVMITGRTHPSLDAQVSAAGAYGPLMKPFAAVALLDCIESALGS